MIQSWIRDRLQPDFPFVEWTVDYESTAPASVTVFYEGGGEPGETELKYLYPRYMIWISSVDFEEAEYLAQAIFEKLHEVRNHPVTVHFFRNGEVVKTKEYNLKKIVAATLPTRIGVEDNKMQYSVNFDATLIDKKEDDTDESA